MTNCVGRSSLRRNSCNRPSGWRVVSFFALNGLLLLPYGVQKAEGSVSLISQQRSDWKLFVTDKSPGGNCFFHRGLDGCLDHPSAYLGNPATKKSQRCRNSVEQRQTLCKMHHMLVDACLVDAVTRPAHGDVQVCRAAERGQLWLKLHADDATLLPNSSVFCVRFWREGFIITVRTLSLHFLGHPLVSQNRTELPTFLCTLDKKILVNHLSALLSLKNLTIKTSPQHGELPKLRHLPLEEVLRNRHSADDRPSDAEPHSAQ